MTITRLYRRIDATRAYCFNIESSRTLTDQELDQLRLLLADGFLIDTVSLTPVLEGERVVEVGPRLNFATAWSSNMVSICRATGLGLRQPGGAFPSLSGAGGRGYAGLYRGAP